MLFPQLVPQYYDEKHKDILARMESSYAESITINQSFWAEADTDWRFFSGDQTLWNDIYGNLPANRRRQFNFNRIRTIINMVSGYQRRNRKSIIVNGVENADNLTADQFTKAIMWANNKENILETISESFEGALVGGINLLQVWMDYRSDPISGNIRVENCNYNSFLIDPFFRKHDLSDCNFIWKRTFLTKRECIALLPEMAEEIMGLQGGDSGNGRDGKFQYMPESYNYGIRQLLTYDEYYYRSYRECKMLVDTQTGETMEWKSSDDDALKLYLNTFPTVTVINQEIPTVRVAIVVQGRVMHDGPQVSINGLDKYPFVPVLGYYAPQMPYYPWRVQGMVRGLRDAQYLYNRRKIIELDILESQITSGFKYKENALVNPADVFLAGQGKGLALKEEAQMSDVEQIIAPQIPPSMIQLSDILAKEIQQISGVNEELLGSAVDDKAGVLSMLRQGAGLTTLQTLFDQLDFSQKLLGELFIDLIQANFTPGKMKKILGGQEPTAQFYHKAFGVYNAVVEEGLNTATQKQMNFAQLLQLREAGLPIPNEVILEAATIQDKKKVMDAMMKQQQQQQQTEQAQMQSVMAEQQARTGLAQARTIADRGLGIERLSRVEENKALAQERKAEAHKDNKIALLNLIKSIKEIENIDLGQLEKLIALSALVNEKQDTIKQETQENPAFVEQPAVPSVG